MKALLALAAVGGLGALLYARLRARQAAQRVPVYVPPGPGSVFAPTPFYTASVPMPLMAGYGSSAPDMWWPQPSGAPAPVLPRGAQVIGVNW